MSQRNNYGTTAMMTEFLSLLQQQVDVQEDIMNSRREPFDINPLEELVDTFLEGEKANKIHRFEEQYEQEKILGEKQLDDFVRQIVLEWAGQNRGFPFSVQDVTSAYTVKGVCPIRLERNPFDKYIQTTIDIDREKFEQLRGHEYHLADKHKPFCFECSAVINEQVHHEPDISFIEYRTPIYKEYHELIKTINEAREGVERTTAFGKPRREKILKKLLVRKEESENASLLSVGARVKGDNSLRRKILGKIINLDERMPDEQKIISHQDQRLLIKDRLGALIIVPQERHGYSFLEYIRSGNLYSKGVFGILGDEQGRGVKDHWLTPKNNFSGLKFNINYCGELIECRIQTPDDYSQSEADHGPYRFRYDQRIKRVEQELKIPCSQIEKLVGRLFP